MLDHYTSGASFMQKRRAFGNQPLDSSPGCRYGHVQFFLYDHYNIDMLEGQHVHVYQICKSVYKISLANLLRLTGWNSLNTDLDMRPLE